MAKDIDAIKIAGHETRGRRTKAEKARQVTETLKGFEATSKGLMRSLDFALPLGLFAFTSWSSRMRITAVEGNISFVVLTPGASYYLTPTYKGRPVMEIHFGFPELFAAEGMGMLTILMSMPGSDIIGLVENGLALGLYHVFLNGGSLPLPGMAGVTVSPLGPVFDILGLLFQFTGSTSSSLPLFGLFPSTKWVGNTEMRLNVESAITSGKLARPPPDDPSGVPTPIAIDPLIQRIQLYSAMRALAHGAFLTLLLKRGGGVVPTE